ncbi:MAG: H-NS histone family protein [Lamprobacter sp.]|uniref:H-NS histone family protein n=1 Tax=Lamprobacter sp. TaxID=3100796 RepID=UPI002B261191|nr:H-NS histone family protein [Lamprobacter sp.]MEA3638561.1 H-NS histone family protein [Lamprobacter sp.]
MNHYEQLSAEEIQAQLDQVAQEQQQLHQALELRHKAEALALVAEVKQLILDRGYEVGEIAELIIGRAGGKKQRGTKRTAVASASYTGYADPDNPDNVYTRGRMPNWLIEKMAANGFDPADPEQRQQFKQQHLVELAA